MILGYVDTDDRVYDLGFATLRMRIRIEPAEAGGSQVVFSQAGGEGAVAYRVAAEEDVTLAVGMDHGGDLVPLLRPVEGRLVRHEKGVLFIASPSSRDAGEPPFFLVKVRAMPSAVKFFFEDRGGAELVSIPVRASGRRGRGGRGSPPPARGGGRRALASPCVAGLFFFPPPRPGAKFPEV